MASERYIAPPVETDPDILAQASFDRLATEVEGWEPAEGNLETIVLETTADMAAQVRDLASQVGTAIFRWYGATLLGLPPQDAAPASVTSTWTVEDDKGYTIDAGTQVTIAETGSDLHGFEVLTAVDIAPGATETAPGQVLLEALIAGTDANGLSAAPQLVDTLPWVVGIETESASGAPVATSGGIDAETDDEYLDRLVAELEMLTPRPITADNFASLYQYNFAEVYRAMAADLYNPADNSYSNEKMVTLFGVDADGNSVSQAVKDAAAAYFEDMREVNFIVNFDDPTYTAIDVTCTVTHVSTYSPEQVKADVESALAYYLSPANWGRGLYAQATGDTTVPYWIDQDRVYYWELITLVNNVDGVERVTALTINGGNVDIVLAEPAPLTQPGAIAVTVV